MRFTAGRHLRLFLCRCISFSRIAGKHFRMKVKKSHLSFADFEVAMAKIERFDAINQQLLSVVDAQILEVNDAMNTLACMLLDSISELS